MREFSKGYKIALDHGGYAEVIRKIGSGGQGIVYEVTLHNKRYALKWYTCKLKNQEAFRENLGSNIEMGSPDDKFLWPKYLTIEEEGSFGYVMDLRPPEFSDFSDILNNTVKFPSAEIMIKSGLNIVNGFRGLHRKGRSYQDLNDGNFFINVAVGDVLICDNDNVTPGDQKNSGDVGGKPGYMAPEVFRGDSHPNSLTDFHSLAVILFKLFLRHDPLWGAAHEYTPCITEEREMELYGTHPVFIFDPNDTSNRPVSGVHPNPINLWPRYPAFFQDAFIESFVKGMKEPNARLPANEWQKILIRLRDEAISCPFCKRDWPINKLSQNSPILCPCGRTYSIPLRLQVGKYRVPLFPGKKLYACHTVDDSDDYNTLTGEVIMNKNNPGLWGIKNLSQETWEMITPGGERKVIAPGSVVPIGMGISVMFKELIGKIV
ncbi:MAG: serine/threonine-protein kinase [Treponema sp.]|jgi:serine/threonine protein kinase|nr:serine/threonine-protein kinase [Treponema sp.]